MRRMVCILCFVTLCVLVAAAQQPTAPGSPAQASQAIRVATKLVIEEVTVKDKGGKSIGGLSANDFILTEDGVPQTISFVEFQQLQAAVEFSGAHTITRFGCPHCSARNPNANCA